MSVATRYVRFGGLKKKADSGIRRQGDRLIGPKNLAVEGGVEGRHGRLRSGWKSS